jgi:hypothetical protein
LPFRDHGQRREAHSGNTLPNVSSAAIDRRQREQDVTSNRAAVLCHERDEGHLRQAKPMGDVGLLGPTERQLVHAADRLDICEHLGTDSDHES